jgi:hypothetical protein
LTHDVAEGALVLFFAGEIVELGRLVQRLRDAVQRRDDDLELGTLAAEGLGSLGVGPNARVLELAIDLFEPFALDVIVKDTSAKPRSAL